MDIVYDMDGVQIRIGDTVEWYHRESVTYIFTVDRVFYDSIWGGDMPEPYCTDYHTGEPEYDHPNWHMSNSARVIERKPKTTWEGSTIKFNFT